MPFLARNLSYRRFSDSFQPIDDRTSSKIVTCFNLAIYHGRGQSSKTDLQTAIKSFISLVSEETVINEKGKGLACGLQPDIQFVLSSVCNFVLAFSLIFLRC